MKTYRNKFNIKYGFDKNESHSLAEISKLTKLKLSSLQDIYNKGIGAYKTNPQSVRPNVKSKEQWAMARVYSAIMGGKAAKVDANELSKGKMEKGGLIAPNGKKSNLTAEQYKLVRTPAFKKWFGDWENSPESASKVVDENGEPKVVYRTTKKEDYHNDFLKNKYVFGIYFSEDIKSTKIYGQFTKEYFLNIKNPKLLRGIDYDEMWIYSIITKDKYKNLKDNNYDGAIWKTKNVFYELVVFEPNQIKLADGTNTTFDANNPDIRYKDGGTTKTFTYTIGGL